MNRARVLLPVIACLLASPAVGATFVVDSVDDRIDAVPGDGTCESEAGACTLRAAVMEANASPGPDRIVLPAGDFALTLAGDDEDESRAGDLDVWEDLEVVGSGRGLSVVAGSSFRLFELHAGALELRSLSLRPGGRGVTARAGTLTLQEVLVELAGIGLLVEDATLLVEDSELFGGRGPAVVLTRSSASLARMAIHDVAGGNEGGGLVLDGSSVEVFESSFERITGTGLEFFGFEGGGAVWLRGGDARFVGCDFRDNESLNGVGGAIAAFTFPALRLESCRFEGNRAAIYGGAIYGGGVAEGCSFVGNESLQGAGGAWASWARGERVELTQCTLSGNRAAREGGGLVAFDAAVSLRHSTITANEAGTDDGEPAGGGGLSVSSGAEVDLVGTILAGNLADGAGPDCAGRIRAASHGLVGDPAGCELPPVAPGLLVGVDPLLRPLAAGHHELEPASPAVDASDAGACVDEDGQPLLLDALGRARPLDGDGDGLAACDMGALESCGGDADGDGLGDACDCAPLEPGSLRPPPPLSSLRCAAGGAAGEVALEWEDLSGELGSGLRASVAAGSLDALRLARAAEAPCVANDLVPAAWLEAPAVPGSRYYLVRLEDACGPPSGSGWGTDSMGDDRPACP